MASKTIKGLFIEIGADTTKLEKAFRAADNSIKQTQSQLRELNKELKLNPGNKNLLKDKYTAIGREIEDTKTKLTQLEEAQKQMDAEGVDKNSRAYQDLQTEIDTTKAKLGDLEKEQKQFGSVGAQQIAAVGEKLKSVGSTMSDIGGKMTATITVPLVTGAAAAVNSYGDVDKQFRLVEQTMGDTANTAEDFSGLWDQMGESAKNSVYGMQDAADATLNFARQGFTAKQATDMLTPAMSLAAGTGTDLSEVTAGLGNALKMFGADSSEAASYADVLARAQAQANTNTSELFEAMSVAGPICKTVGWNIQDLATVTDIFGNAGISGSEGATALKTGLARLAAPAKEGAQYMDALGLSTGQTYAIFNDDGSMKSMEEVLQNLNSAFDGLTQEEELSAASAIFGKNQMAKWLTLIQTSPEDVSSLRSALDDCTGSADDMANALMEGTGGSIEQLKSTFDVLTVTLGEQLAPAFQPVIDALINMMNGFMSLSPETQQMIMRLAAVAAAIGPILLIGGKLLMGIGQFMTLAPQISAGITAIRTAMTSTTGIIGIVIAAIAAVVLALITLYNENEDFRNAVDAAWNAIRDVIGTVVEAIKGFWESTLKPAFEAIGEFCQNTLWPIIQVIFMAIGQIVSAVFQLIKGYWENILFPVFGAIRDFLTGVLGPIFKTIFNGIAAIVQAVFTVIQGYWNYILKPIFNGICSFITGILAPAFQTVFGAIKSIVQTVFKAIQGFWNTILSPVFNAIKAGVMAVKVAVSGPLEDVRDKFKSVFNGIKSFLSPIIEWLKGVFNFKWSLPDIKLPHFSIDGKFSLNPPSVPKLSVDWYDKGGIFDSPSVIGVGEKRPEFVGALDDLREIVRQELSAASNAQMNQMIGLLTQLVELERQPRPVTGTMDLDLSRTKQQIHSDMEDYFSRQYNNTQAVWA